MARSQRLRYSTHPHESLPGVVVVSLVDGLEVVEIGTLRPATDHPGTLRIYYTAGGPSLGRCLGRSESVDQGVQILGFYRRSLLNIAFCVAYGHNDTLHTRFRKER